MTTTQTLNPNPFNRAVIEEFRANAGHVSRFPGSKLLLLTTTGARTGLPRTTPLMYLPDGDRLVVFASNGGSPTAPAWFRNILANPEVTVEVGDDRYTARATVIDEREYDELWARQIAVEPDFAQFRPRTTRVIPLVALERA
ncbi:nitroreductase/quinone reductase family protein [Bailinhaonella thermotolerans]|uniref:Nitroreductase family deazaflavin-dependent oxidoreductase n=1 Tax=Bailinhaonella thermotolerans TaxID=1070861 RepID=A0A3A4AYR8_9ACTN|nr:nitroreductase/quinone reductase family protein [Bailinhaonella thermotolerans]RJL30997.1 nitroreductase family deazaflavin-dependent oxidoreductase [Bailinhaonella thermotolerans]